MAATKVLIWDPCPVGLPVILTGAHARKPQDAARCCVVEHSIPYTK